MLLNEKIVISEGLLKTYLILSFLKPFCAMSVITHQGVGFLKKKNKNLPKMRPVASILRLNHFHIVGRSSKMILLQGICLIFGRFQIILKNDSISRYWQLASLGVGIFKGVQVNINWTLQQKDDFKKPFCPDLIQPRAHVFILIFFTALISTLFGHSS